MKRGGEYHKLGVVLRILWCLFIIIWCEWIISGKVFCSFVIIFMGTMTIHTQQHNEQQMRVMCRTHSESSTRQ